MTRVQTGTEGTRVQTGIEGLDELLRGGFPENTVNLVSGPAGSAKSLLGLQFLYNGASKYGETGVYITLEDSRENIERALKVYNMDYEKYEADGKFYLIDLGDLRKECNIDEEMEVGLLAFSTLDEFLQKHLNVTGAKRIVIDSLTAVGLYYQSVEILRREMFRFSRMLKDHRVTSLLITESLEGQGALTRYGIEQFIADSFIVMGLEDVKGELRRTITVRKMRFTKHDTAIHPLLITNSGIEVSAEERVLR
jgi:circadian clock protein KaiC